MIEKQQENIKKSFAKALAILGRTGMVFYYNSEESQKDKEAVLDAVKQNGLALDYSEGLQNNTDLGRTGMVFYYNSEESQKDKEAVLDTVKQNGLALDYSEGLQNNTEEVLAALSSEQKSSTYPNRFFDQKNAQVDDVVPAPEARANLN